MKEVLLRRFCPMAIKTVHKYWSSLLFVHESITMYVVMHPAGLTIQLSIG